MRYIFSMHAFEKWAIRFPDPRLAQLANLREFGETSILRALSPLATGEEGLGPSLREAFLSICEGPGRDVYLRVLERAEVGDYPLAALRSLLLQSQGQRIFRQDLRQKIERSLGVSPAAEIYLLPDHLYRAAAAEIGFPLAFYKPDTIYIQAGLADSVLLHELLHSAQYHFSGSVGLPLSPRDHIALEVLEAVTEEWVVRNGQGSLYQDLRERLFRICPDACPQELVLLHPADMLRTLEREEADFVRLWKRASLPTSEELV